LFWRARIHLADGEVDIAERLLGRAEDGGHSFVGLGYSWLEHARGSRQHWSATYDRQLVDIFRVQEEISQATADALAESLGVRQVKVMTATNDLEAYEWFPRGRHLFAQRGANLPAARELLERAVERDPQFSDAWAALAATWYVWRSYAAEPDGVSTLDRSAMAAAKALGLF